MGTKLGNELQFIIEKKEAQNKAQELLDKAKENESLQDLIPYRVNRNTVKLVRAEKYRSLIKDKI